MPMKDIESQAMFLARLGKIKLGVFVPGENGGYGHPEATPFFMFRDAPKLAAYYGDVEINELSIHFPFVDFDRNIEGYHRLWAGSGRKGGVNICKGDGERVLSALPFTVKKKESGGVGVYRAPGDRRVDDGIALCDFTWDGHEFKRGMTVPCPGIKHHLYPQCQNCAPSTILRIMIREPEAVREYGYYQIATRSVGNYKHFLAVWKQITDDGRLAVPMNAVPFILRIMPQSTVYQDKKSRMWQAGEAFFLRLLVDLDTLNKMESARANRLDRLLVGSTQANEPIFDARPEPEAIEETDLEEDDLENAPPVEGEYAEEKSAQEVESAPETPNSDNGERPYDAETVIAKLNERANAMPADQQVRCIDEAMSAWAGTVYVKLQECLMPDEKAAEEADLVLFGIFKTFHNDLTIAQVNALLLWLLESKEPDSGGMFILHRHAPAEAKAVYDWAVLTNLKVPPF